MMPTPYHTSLDVHGADCLMCTFTIEHLGGKLTGVQKIIVNPARHEIRLVHDNAKTPQAIMDLIRQLGYDAQIRETDMPGTNEESP